VWLDAPLNIRVKRVAQREHAEPEGILEDVRRREIGERRRYKDIYNIDIADTSIHDLVINTVARTPEEITKIILKALPEVHE
jgi:cytidylate kinase